MPPTWRPLAMASKKRNANLHGAPRCHGHAHLQTGSESLVRRLQKAYAALVVAETHRGGAAGPAGELGHTGQCFRGCAVDSELDLLPATLGLVAQNCGSRHEL